MAYLLDSNVFIQAKNLHYGFDFCPAFWDWIDTAHAAGSVFSVDGVRTELLSGADALSTWAQQRGSSFFLQPDASPLGSLQRASVWVSGAGYEPAAVATFFQIADLYLVAQALTGGHTAVTHEVPSTSTKRIKIPDACLGLGLRYVTPFEMLRTEQARFVLRS
ncbi:MAG TPA: DUF4411 family protein [Acidimicrobiales bacterium]|nr:DUF4411 family protein [Acidimicrobiales bacterium]